jgi:hypothetical protein
MPEIFVNGGITMSKKAIIALTVSLSATVLLVGAATAGTLICKKIYEKKYFSANKSELY